MADGDSNPAVVARYVQRNALRARLVQRAENLAHCSLNQRVTAAPPQWLLPISAWPVSQPPTDCLERVNATDIREELAAMRQCVNRGQPFGEVKWQTATAQALSLESSFRNSWRPKMKEKNGGNANAK